MSDLFKDLEKAEKEGDSLEEVFLKYKELSDKQLQDIQENCQSAWCDFAKKTTLAKPIEYLSKPKQKVNSSSIGDIVRTPTTHAEDFERKRDSKGNAVYVNKHTGEIWSKSNTRHSDKAGEWKVGLNGKEPTASKKITIGDSDGKIIKKDDK